MAWPRTTEASPSLRAGRAAVLPWIFAAAYLLLHGVAATCLPERFDPLSTVLIVVAEWIAIFACVRAAWRVAPEVRTYWLLLASAILLHSAAMSLDAITEITQTPLLNHVPAIQVMLSMLWSVPLLAAISIQTDARILPMTRIVHGFFSIATGVLIYVQIFSLLTVRGGTHPSDELLVTRLFDLIDLFLAATGTIRWLGSSRDEERRFFRVLAVFLWIDMLLPAIHNRMLMRHDYVWLDLLISTPYVVLVALMMTMRNRAVQMPQSAFIRAVRSGSPVFLASALVLLSVITARSHFYLGLTTALLAIAGYGLLNIFVQSRGLEAEESLLASKTELEKLVDLDGLTGIANRRAFDERLRHEVAMALRIHQPVSLLMMDVDHFKALNDARGHVEGDECLIRIAAALELALPRATDFVARYGGEEFAAILALTDEAGAMVVAERIRERILDLGLSHAGALAGVVTLSLGVSTFEGGASCSPADLMEAADRALYLAKRNGRNRAVFQRMDHQTDILPFPGRG